MTFDSKPTNLKNLTCLCLNFVKALSLTCLFTPISALAQPSLLPGNTSNVESLGRMFSPNIRETLSACWDRGKANLAAGAAEDGLVICGDGSHHPSVKFNEYVETVSDFFAASFLIGARSALSSNSQLTPEMLAAYLNSPKGQDSLRQALEISLTSSKLLPPDSTESIRFLADSIMKRSQPVLENPSTLANLLGTTEQYQQVVQKFCTSPGMSVAQAENQLPGLNSIQLYAICVQASGLGDNLTRLQKQPR